MSLHLLQKNYIIRSLLASYIGGKDTEYEIRRFTFLFYTVFQNIYFFILLLSSTLFSSGSYTVILALSINFFLNISAFILTYRKINIYALYIYLNLAWCMLHNYLISTTATHIIGLFVFLTIWAMLALLLLGKNHFLLVILLSSIIFSFDLAQEITKTDQSFIALFSKPNKIAHYVMPIILYGPFYLIILLTTSFYYFLNKLQARIKDKILIRQRNYINKIQQLNNKLTEYSFYHSHELRAPVSKILGLSELIKTMNTDNKTDPNNSIDLTNLNNEITMAANEIDSIIKDMNAKLEKS